MATFILPMPEWEAVQIPDGRVVMEKEIRLQLSPVSLPDGSVFQDINLGTAGFFTYRRLSVGPAEIWNEETLNWEADPGVDVSAFQPTSLIFQADGLFPWWATVMATGLKTSDGDDKFQEAVAGSEYPRYFFRCYFEAEMDDGTTLSRLSAASASIRFLAIGESMLAGLRIDKPPEEAGQIQLFLKDENRRLIGVVELQRIGNDARLSLMQLDNSGNPVSRMTIGEDGSIEVAANQQSAFLRTEVQLMTSGDIAIRSAPGKAVTINDNLSIAASGNNINLSSQGEINLQATAVNINNDLRITTASNGVQLSTQGELTLEAAKVIIDTELEVDEVLYLPQDQSTNDPPPPSQKKWIR